MQMDAFVSGKSPDWCLWGWCMSCVGYVGRLSRWSMQRIGDELFQPNLPVDRIISPGLVIVWWKSKTRAWSLETIRFRRLTHKGVHMPGKWRSLKLPIKTGKGKHNLMKNRDHKAVKILKRRMQFPVSGCCLRYTLKESGGPMKIFSGRLSFNVIRIL